MWIGFGGTWHTGDEPLPWTAHDVLWKALAARADHVRFHKRLRGVRRLRCRRTWRPDMYVPHFNTLEDQVQIVRRSRPSGPWS